VPIARLVGMRLARLKDVPALLWGLIVVALGLRIALWLTYSPSVLNLADAAQYANLASGDLFADATRSAGYPLFLRAIHLLSSQIEITIVLQHLLGIATGLLVYAIVRRVGAPLWAGLAGAAAVLLPLDQIFLEHALMTETLWTFLIAASVYAGVRVLDAGRPLWRGTTTRHLWIAAAGALIGISVWVRTASVVMIPVFALWVVLALDGRWRERLGLGAVALTASAISLLAYSGIQEAGTGTFGFSRVGGWGLYARTAPFADCTEFEPPSGTRALCETTPINQRPGPDFYGQLPESPARRLFGGPPNGNDKLQEFAVRAIIAQPIEYAKDVGRDFIRYFDPGFKPKDYSGVGYDVLDVARRADGIEGAVAAALNAYYADDRYTIDPEVATLSDLQQVIRVHPKLLLASLLLGIAGLLVSDRRQRWTLALLLGTSLVLLLVPPATVIWTSRYAVPVNGFVVAAGVIGLWLVVSRVRERARRVDRLQAAR
jgi:hypothetical protein